MKRFTLALLAVVTLAAAPTWEKIAETRALGWIRAFNAGDEELLRFVREHMTPEAFARLPAEERAKTNAQLRASHGQLEVSDVLADGSGITLKVLDSRRERLTFSFSFEASEPYRISRLMISMGGHDEEGEALPIPKGVPRLASLTREEMAKWIDGYVSDLAKRDLFSGTVLVGKADEVLFEKAYGLASRRDNAPNRPSTRFNVGSITKQFTKTAIGQLAAEGKLALTDTIAKHLPDYPNRDVASKITIDQLLTHTSGLGDIFTDEWEKTPRQKVRTIAEQIALYADDPLQFEPGKGKRYSNYGYVVLGAIVEAASGMSYEEYIQKRVFDPARMTASGLFEWDKPVADLAMGYSKREGNVAENRGQLPPRPSPAGGSQSTARDLFKFDRALRGGKLLDAKWTKWFLGGGGEIIYAGGAPGVNAIVASDGTWTVVVVSNLDPPAASHVVEKVIYRGLK